MEPLRVGVLGVGNISGIYFKNLTSYPEIEVVGCADLDIARAEAAAKEHGLTKAVSPDELIADTSVELILNLTVPKVHGPLAQAAIDSGKHVYNEKPLATDYEGAKKLVESAKAKGLYVGCAPDTFLGAGLQTARAAIDAGKIGRPMAAQAAMMGWGPEPWHPSPEFFYKPGGGPMLDMGPYYLTALVSLLGGIRRVAGMTAITFPSRTIGSEPLKGQEIIVETPTHLAGTLEFHSGAIAQICTSFDIAVSTMDWNHPITIFGTEATMKVPDPNTFGGEVQIREKDSDEWVTLPHSHGYGENARGLGVRDIAIARETGAAARASGDLALHVLETMLSFDRSSKSGQFVTLETSVERPAPMPA
jgi:predicted dehydrogenase